MKIKIINNDYVMAGIQEGDILEAKVKTGKFVLNGLCYQVTSPRKTFISVNIQPKDMVIVED